MQFAHRDRPPQLTPEHLDEYWAHGWFRMRQNVFTTHFLEFGGRLFPAVWLRVRLQDWHGDKTLTALDRRHRNLTLRFERIDPAEPSGPHEALFLKYRSSLPFDVAPTLSSLLAGPHETDLFRTWRADLLAGADLRASGVFDLGGRSAAGITSFYDPDFKKDSLGKYLIYKKMEFCRDRGVQWYYPGYVAPGYPRFDYKLALGAGALEVLDLTSGTWKPLEPGAEVPNPLTLMEGRLSDLNAELARQGSGSQILGYLHLDINLNPQVQGLGLFDYPLFLPWGPLDGDVATPVVYDPRSDLYHLLSCRTLHRLPEASVPGAPWGGALWFPDRILFSTAVPAVMAEALVHWFPPAQVRASQNS